jgi:hypothetical protein
MSQITKEETQALKSRFKDVRMKVDALASGGINPAYLQEIFIDFARFIGDLYDLAERDAENF